MARLIGRHHLIYPNYYQYSIRFVRPEIKQPSYFLAFLAESVHERTLIDELDLICKRLIENFIAEGFSEEKITIGINTVRMILLRNNNVLGKEEIDYIAKFRGYKNKSVSSAARSFINVVRDFCPDRLGKEF